LGERKIQKLGTFYLKQGDIHQVAFGTIWFYNTLNKLSLRGDVESGVRPAGGAFIHWGNIIEAADVRPAAFYFAVGCTYAIHHLSVREVT